MKKTCIIAVLAAAALLLAGCTEGTEPDGNQKDVLKPETTASIGAAPVEEHHDDFDCGVEGCTIEGEHTHEEDHHKEEHHDDFDCGVEGCTIEGEHTHEEDHHDDFDCGVEGCTIEGEHTHDEDRHEEEHREEEHHDDHHD